MSQYLIVITYDLHCNRNLLDFHSFVVRDETEGGEDDDAAKDGGGAVADGDDDGVAVAVAVELRVGGHGQQAAARGAEAEYD